MNRFIKLIIIFLIISFLKFIINFYRFLRIKYLLQKYNEYLKNPEWKFVMYKLEILRLFKIAGITDSGVSVSQNVGYGTLKVQTISIFNNLNNRNEEVVNIMTGNFYAAIGFYKQKFSETCNPIYWLEFLVFLPQNVSKYFGIKTDNIIVKISQITYWFLGLIASIYAIFDVNLVNYFLNLFN